MTPNRRQMREAYRDLALAEPTFNPIARFSYDPGCLICTRQKDYDQCVKGRYCPMAGGMKVGRAGGTEDLLPELRKLRDRE